MFLYSLIHWAFKMFCCILHSHGFQAFNVSCTLKYTGHLKVLLLHITQSRLSMFLKLSDTLVTLNVLLLHISQLWLSSFQCFFFTLYYTGHFILDVFSNYTVMTCTVFVLWYNSHFKCFVASCTVIGFNVFVLSDTLIIWNVILHIAQSLPTGFLFFLFFFSGGRVYTYIEPFCHVMGFL